MKGMWIKKKNKKKTKNKNTCYNYFASAVVKIAKDMELTSYFFNCNIVYIYDKCNIQPKLSSTCD